MDYAMPAGCRLIFEAGEVQVPEGYTEIPGFDYINRGNVHG